jgi:hypothetical protein
VIAKGNDAKEESPVVLKKPIIFLSAVQKPFQEVLYVVALENGTCLSRDPPQRLY